MVGDPSGGWGGSSQQVLSWHKGRFLARLLEGWAGTSVPAVGCHCTHSTTDTLIFSPSWCFVRELPSHACGCLVVSL